MDTAETNVELNPAETNPVQTAWRANLRVNQMLLEHLTPDMLTARTPGGGYSVAQHLAHIVGVTKYRGVKLDNGLETLPDLFTIREGLAEENPEAFVPETDLARIKDVLAQTAVAVQEAIEKVSGYTETSPYPSADAYLVHMMVHDAHHRGQILLALKTSGYALPDEDAMWLPWKVA